MPSTCTQRKTAASSAASSAAAATPAAEPPAAEPPAGPWHSERVVRAILVLLAIFFVMHLALWKVVYGFVMDADHGRLSETVDLAWSKFKDVRHALD